MEDLKMVQGQQALMAGTKTKQTMPPNRDSDGSMIRQGEP